MKVTVDPAAATFELFIKPSTIFAAIVVYDSSLATLGTFILVWIVSLLLGMKVNDE